VRSMSVSLAGVVEVVVVVNLESEAASIAVAFGNSLQ
jgi:hypothetical protein